MGRVIQVRVSASTFSEDEVRRAWPKLWDLAFERNTPGFPHEMKGVFELVRALDDLYQFGDMDSTAHEALAAGLPRVLADIGELQRQLADWNPQAANRATDRIEDGLSELEKAVPAAWGGQ